MKSLRWKLTWALLIVGSACANVSADDIAKKVLAVGRELFVREWQPGEAGSPGGDGLGPAFNDVSCVGCHLQGGVGGGGPIEKNVDLISKPDLPTAMSATQAKRLFRVHPGFFDENMQPRTTFVLHRFSLDPKYELQRARFIGERNQVDPHPVIRDQLERYVAARPVPMFSSDGLQMHKSQRNTPALFGLGLLDQMPEAFLQELARRQPMQHPGISGRVSPTSMGAGRFGWRGQTSRLHDFVLDACGNEIGLRVPGREQALAPNAPGYQPGGFDMSLEQCAAMIAFVANLPRPVQVSPEDQTSRQVVEAGQVLFTQIGCVACHVDNLGQVQAVYTDMLLHDMGPALRDPAAAIPTSLVRVQVGAVFEKSPEDGNADDVQDAPPPPPPSSIGRSSSGSYGGGGAAALPAASSTTRVGNLIIKKTEIRVPTNLEQEWRTPPLWGVADSAPYMHDGRAQTLVEAVAWHAGEAKPSAEQFFSLSADKQLALIEFLRTLRAPASAN